MKTQNDINDREIDGRRWHVFVRYESARPALAGMAQLTAKGYDEMAVLFNPDLRAGGSVAPWELGQWRSVLRDVVGLGECAS